MGVCQTCHTKTPYYRNDGTLATTHHVGENCTSCHSHEQQFFVDLGTSSDVGSGDHYDSASAAYDDHTASGACVRCHTNGGFQDYIGATGAAMNTNDTFLAKATVYPSGPMTCQTCHNSKSDPTVAGAGLTSVEFVSLNTVNGLDKATGLCSQCHQGRESTASINSKIASSVATASKGLGFVATSATGAGSTTTIAKSGLTAGQYVGYTLVFTNNANQGAKVMVTANDTGTITFDPAVGTATHAAITGPPAIPADSFTLWPTATGGAGDAYAGVRQGGLVRGTTLVDSNRAWTANQWTNYYVFIQTDPSSGNPNGGLYRLITGNDATSLTVANAGLTSGMPFPAVIANGSRYQILVKEDTTVLDAVAAGISFSNSHYLPASAILHGAEAMIGYQNPSNWANGSQRVAGAKSYSKKNLHGVSQDMCTSCHSPHTLAVAVNKTTCGRCHFKEDGTAVTNMAELEETRQFGFDGDIDGDGNANESLKDEIAGQAATLMTAIKNYALTKAGGAICYDAATNPYWFKDNGLGGGTAADGICQTGEMVSTNAYGASGAGWFTPRLLRATFNYQIYVKEPGAWAHNPRYIIEMLYDSIRDLNLALGNTTQVGYKCVVSATGVATALDTDGTCTLQVGTTRTLMPRRSFLAGSHFDGQKNAFHVRDTTITSAGMTSYPCLRCHGGQQGLEQYVGTAKFYDQTQAPAAAVPPAMGLQCTTCHQPLASDTDMKRMRDLGASAIGGVRFPGHWAGGTLGAPGSAGAPSEIILGSTSFATKSDMICTTCHNGRDINGAGVDSYLAGTWSGIDIPGRAFAGTASIVANGSTIRITGLPTYLAASPAGTPNNWLYTTSCQAVGKYITLSGSTNYNGTYAITACGNGTADVAKAYVADEAAVSWASFAASTKNNHDIQSAGVLFGSDGHIGYEYATKTYAGRKQHHGATASCTECHSPKGSRHSFEVAESVTAGICASCHTGTAYSTWSAPARNLSAGPGYDSDPTTTTLAAELGSFVKAVGAAINQYTRNAGVTPATGNICLDGTFSVKAQVGNTTGNCATGTTASWGGGYDPEMVRAMFNMTMCTATDPAPWAHNFDYCAQLLYDSAVDLGLTPANLTRP